MFLSHENSIFHIQITFITSDDQIAPTKDAATVTDDFTPVATETQSNGTLDDVGRTDRAQVTDASTQTDRKQEYCFQCRFHHCHHHHVIVKDDNATTDDVGVKTVSVNHASSKLKCSDKECANSSLIGHRSSCSDAKEPIKLEDRPK